MNETTITLAARRKRCGRGAVMAAIKRGEIDARYVCGRWLVCTPSLVGWKPRKKGRPVLKKIV